MPRSGKDYPVNRGNDWVNRLSPRRGVELVRARTPSSSVLARTLSSSILVGAATGMRSQLGVAAVVLRANPDCLPPFLRTRAASRGAVGGAAAEILADKSPRIGDRMRPGPLSARFVLGGLAGGLLAYAERRPVAPAAVVASAAAGLGAKVGHDLRARAARTVPDSVVAVAEDLVAISLAAAGTHQERGADPRSRPIGGGSMAG
jgi:uncharacterized membrane protein